MAPTGTLTPAPTHEFYLYVAGATPNSTRALRNIKEICEQHLAGRYVLRIIDMQQEPQLAQQEQIIAAPTLVRRRPLPLRRLVGDLSNRAAVLAVLELDPLSPPATIPS
jgi:circadian clock protein KaiB